MLVVNFDNYESDYFLLDLIEELESNRENGKNNNNYDLMLEKLKLILNVVKIFGSENTKGDIFYSFVFRIRKHCLNEDSKPNYLPNNYDELVREFKGECVKNFPDVNVLTNLSFRFLEMIKLVK